jgi:hypothetical protein
MSACSHQKREGEVSQTGNETRCPHCGRALTGASPAICDAARRKREYVWGTIPLTIGVLALSTALGLHELWAFLSSIFLGTLAVGFGAYGLRRDGGTLALAGLILGSIAALFMIIVLGIAVAVGDL